MCYYGCWKKARKIKKKRKNKRRDKGLKVSFKGIF